MIFLPADNPGWDYKTSRQGCTIGRKGSSIPIGLASRQGCTIGRKQFYDPHDIFELR